VRLAKDPATRALYLVGRAAARMADTSRACAAVAASPALRVVLLEADVQDRTAMRRVVVEADQDERDAGGIGLTCLVANAGVTQQILDPTNAVGFSVATSILNTNMMGTMHTIEPMVDVFAKRGHGQIVIISSVSSFFSAVPVLTAYGSSKIAQRVFGECLRSALTPAHTFCHLISSLRQFGLPVVLSVLPRLIVVVIFVFATHKQPCKRTLLTLLLPLLCVSIYIQKQFSHSYSGNVRYRCSDGLPWVCAHANVLVHRKVAATLSSGAVSTWSGFGTSSAQPKISSFFLGGPPRVFD
jgi:short chain dehydrogenase